VLLLHLVATVGDLAGGVSGSLAVFVVLRITRSQLRKHELVSDEEVAAALRAEPPGPEGADDGVSSGVRPRRAGRARS
jgi:hypothetical protein